MDGQPSVYLPVLKQGGDTNTISVVDGIKAPISGLVDVPSNLRPRSYSISPCIVKNAIENLVHEGAIGLVLTGVMILVFLGSVRATVAVFLSIPLSALATFLAHFIGGGTVNTMVLGGLALAFSRLIDNSVVVLENIFRHLEIGEDAAAGIGKRRPGSRLASAGGDADDRSGVLPGNVSVWREQVSVYGAGTGGRLFAVASYLVAMTVVPLFCASFIRVRSIIGEKPRGLMDRFNAASTPDLIVC